MTLFELRDVLNKQNEDGRIIIDFSSDFLNNDIITLHTNPQNPNEIVLTVSFYYRPIHLTDVFQKNLIKHLNCYSKNFKYRPHYKTKLAKILYK
jgi:hypothetical protein